MGLITIIGGDLGVAVVMRIIAGFRVQIRITNNS
jgi:hypothetical protein